uniref:trimethylamine methyltransferase family protein n=1 Tax=Xanthomonas arboricola TaxID=56448 RepID=UPI0019D28348
VPPEVNLVARNAYRNCRVGGPHVVFAPVAGPPGVLESSGTKHTGAMADFKDFVKLSQAYDVIHVLGQMVEPQDVNIAVRHLETTHAQLTLGDKVPYFYCRGDGQLEDSFAMLRIALGKDEAAFESEAHCYTICNTNSPLQLD